jgi:hypothetical protein
MHLPYIKRVADSRLVLVFNGNGKPFLSSKGYLRKFRGEVGIGA